MYKAGITGTIASGKSTVSKILKQRGFPVFNSDQYARMITHAGNPCCEPLIRVLGEEVRMENGDIDRQKMAAIIFQDESIRKQANAIAHPFVKEGLLHFFAHQNGALCFAEVPLLFEAGWQDLFDETCVVTCSEKTAVERMMKDRNYTKEEAEERYHSQIDFHKQMSMADTIIQNDGDKDALNASVNKWIASLRKKSRNGKTSA